MAALDYLQLGLRYAHILGAIMLMGGAIFARFALLPEVAGNPQWNELHEAIRRRWSKLVMLASVLLLLSGIANLGIYGAKYQFPTFHLYNMVAGIKFLLALPIFFIAATLSGRSSLARKFQAQGKFWLSLNLVLALIMVLIGGGLRFADRELKSPLSAEKITERAAK